MSNVFETYEPISARVAIAQSEPFKIVLDAALYLSQKHGHPISRSRVEGWWNLDYSLHGHYVGVATCPVCGLGFKVSNGPAYYGPEFSGDSINSPCDFDYNKNKRYFADNMMKFSYEELRRIFSDPTDRTPQKWIENLIDTLPDRWEWVTARVAYFDDVITEWGYDPEDYDLELIEDEGHNTDTLFYQPEICRIPPRIRKHLGIGNTVAIVKYHSEFSGYHYSWYDTEQMEELMSRVD